MRFYELTYTKGKQSKHMEVREASKEDAILQALTLWRLQDTPAVRKQIIVKGKNK